MLRHSSLKKYQECLMSSNTILLGPESIIHQAPDYNLDTYNILIVCDGFLETRRNDFYTFCHVLKDRFFTISPYSYFKEHINFFAYYTKSETDQFDYVDPEFDPKNDLFTKDQSENLKKTAFGAYVHGDVFAFENINNVFNLVQLIQFKHGNHLFTGEEVWLNNQSKSFGAIGIAVYTDFQEIDQKIQVRNIRGIPESFYDIRGSFSVYSFNSKKSNAFCFTLYGYDLVQKASRDIYWGFEYTFVHELGHAVYGFTEKIDGDMSSSKIGLGDEYSIDGQLHYRFAKLGEPLEPNVTAAKSINPDYDYQNLYPLGNPIDKSKIKWKDLMTQKDFEKITRHIVVYRHGPIYTPDTEAYYQNSSFSRSAVGLVEGGAGFIKGVFRPSLDCRMRGHYNATPEFPQGSDFCRVCEKHLQRTITGHYWARLGAHLPIKVLDWLHIKNTFVPLYTSLSQSLNTITEDNIVGIITARMAIMLDQAGLYLRLLGIGIQGNYAFIQYGLLIIDPYFYGLYKTIGDGYGYVNNENSDIHPIPSGYIYNDSERREVYFRSEEGAHKIYFSDGFAGDLQQLKNHMRVYCPPDPAWLEARQNSAVAFDNIVRKQFDIPTYPIQSDNTLKISRTQRQRLNHNILGSLESELQGYAQYKAHRKADVPPFQVSQEMWTRMKNIYDPINFSLNPNRLDCFY